MKQKEKEIIKHLRKGKRVNISSIARELELPVSTVSDAIRRIEKRYVLKRSSLLDYHRLGYFANAKIAIKVLEKKKLLDFLRGEEHVNSIYYIDSGFDFFVDVVCKDAVEMKHWIDDLEAAFDVEVLVFQVLKVEEIERFVP